VTEPLIPELAPFFTPPPTPDAVRFPLQWILENAAAPIQYRATTEVAKLDPREVAGVELLPLTYPPAIMLALAQSGDGTWSGGMLSVPSPKGNGVEGVGTVNAVRRLLEYGWDKDSPPLIRARRILFRLLAEDEDPAYLFEVAGKGKLEPEVARHWRGVLREAAAAALAQAGYEGDPRLRGAARRILDRIGNFLSGPDARKPWVRVGNRQVLPEEASPPSIYALQMLAHMTLFRSEHHAVMDRIFHHLEQPMPRQESMQVVGSEILAQPHLVLGDMLPHRNAVDADVPFALMWLELMARLGFLQRHEGWTKLFDRFIDDRDRAAVWHPHKGSETPNSTNPYVWPSFPLDTPTEGLVRWTDVTFRIGLIARLAGRPIELI
jgi:hypothetical protein